MRAERRALGRLVGGAFWLSALVPRISLADDLAVDDEKPGVRTRVGLGLQRDSLLVSGTELCAREGSAGCVDPQTGAPYEGNLLVGRAGVVDRRLTPGPIRFLLTGERLLNQRVGISLTAGWSAGRHPSALQAWNPLPLYLEGGATYWIVTPRSEAWVLPFARLKTGIGSVWSKTSIQIEESLPSGDPSLPPEQVSRHLELWSRAGLGFAGASGGVMFPLLGRSGPLVEGSVATWFPKSGVSVAARLEYAVWF